MKIYNGIYRGAKIEFGIYDGTSGQMYVSFEIGGENLKKVIGRLSDADLRSALNLPKEDGDAFSFHFNKDENEFNWNFMFDMQKKRTQLEYLVAFCNQVDSLYALGADNPSRKPNALAFG